MYEPKIQIFQKNAHILEMIEIYYGRVRWPACPSGANPIWILA